MAAIRAKSRSDNLIFPRKPEKSLLLEVISLPEGDEDLMPHLKVLLTSGFPEMRLVDDARDTGVSLIGKPYRREDLAQRLREILDAPAGA